MGAFSIRYLWEYLSSVAAQRHVPIDRQINDTAHAHQNYPRYSNIINQNSKFGEFSF